LRAKIFAASRGLLSATLISSIIAPLLAGKPGIEAS
jgi:hypothetical protein